MNHNPFFSSPFIRINEKDSDYMYKAISIYDSLNIKNKDLKALYRLSEIRFKALGDLDNAFINYTKIKNITHDKNLKLNSILNIADILIAKGDLSRAYKLITKEVESSLWDSNEKIKLKIKENQILFYESDLDLVYDNLALILKEYNVQEYDYNDILEIMSIILAIRDDKDILFEKEKNYKVKMAEEEVKNNNKNQIKNIDELWCELEKNPKNSKPVEESKVAIEESKVAVEESKVENN